MEELLFYTIDNKYIKYLSEFEEHISFNKECSGHSRPYLGIVLKIKDYDYIVILKKCHVILRYWKKKLKATIK